LPTCSPRASGCRSTSTHTHFDHCGGNHLFAGRPIYVQRRELDDARSEDDYTIREWVEAPGVRYVPVDGELDEPHTEGQLRVRALDPKLVRLAHEHEPWRPRTV
jgi:N-acyl homoserine lactone hydrolase